MSLPLESVVFSDPLVAMEGVSELPIKNGMGTDGIGRDGPQ